MLAATMFRRSEPSVSPALRCHSDTEPQFTSIRYGERLAEIVATPSIGTVGDSYDNALTETVNGYYKPELFRGPADPGRERRSTTSNSQHSTECTGTTTSASMRYLNDVPPVEFEKAIYAVPNDHNLMVGIK